MVNTTFLFLFWYTYLNFQLPTANKKFLITHYFFTSTHSLLLLQFIFYLFLSWFNLLHGPHVYLHWVLSHFKFQKASLYLLTFGQSSRGCPKQNSLRNSKGIKKQRRRRRRLEEHIETTKKNEKLSRKETEIGERYIKI